MVFIGNPRRGTNMVGGDRIILRASISININVTATVNTKTNEDWTLILKKMPKRLDVLQLLRTGNASAGANTTNITTTTTTQMNANF